jgi:predicted ATPase
MALEKVRQQLLAGKPTSIGQTALFQGIGGLGKTQLAVEYAYQYRGEYPNGVYWITADENIDAQLTQIAVSARWVASESEHAIKLDVARHRLKTYSDCLDRFR